MNEFSFLDYIGDFGDQARTEVKAAAGMRIEEIAKLTGYNYDTIKNWFKDSESVRYKPPAVTSWNTMLYALEAKRKGYESLSELIKNSPCKG